MHLLSDQINLQTLVLETSVINLFTTTIAIPLWVWLDSTTVDQKFKELFVVDIEPELMGHSVASGH